MSVIAYCRLSRQHEQNIPVAYACWLWIEVRFQLLKAYARESSKVTPKLHSRAVPECIRGRVSLCLLLSPQL